MARLAPSSPKVRKRDHEAASKKSHAFRSRIYAIANARYVPQVLIAIAILSAYSNALTGQFLFDDIVTISKNESIRSVLPLIQCLWPPLDSSTSGRPVPNLSFAINYAIGGLDVVGYHLANIILHILNALLVNALILRTLKLYAWKEENDDDISLIALMSSLLWGLHPLQTETVSYVTQRTELLMAFFFLVTLYSACRAWESSTPRSKSLWQSLCILSCGLGMASKEVMVVAPVMVVLYDLSFRGQTPGTLIKSRLPLYLGLFSTWSILGILLSTNPRGDTAGFGLSVTPLEYFTTQLWAITNYLWLVFWPVDLCGDYGVITITDIKIWLPSLILILLLLGLTAWAWFCCRGLAFLSGWFFIILAPTSSIVPILSEPVAERRMYLPLLAPILFVVLGMLELARRWPVGTRDQASQAVKGRRLAVMGVALAVVIALGFATHSRNTVFRSELTFWRDVVEKRPQNARAVKSFGIVSLRENRFDSAIASFERYNELQPNDVDTLYNLANLHAIQGRAERAVSYYDQVIELRPGMFEAVFNRALLLQELGQIDQAMAGYRAAIELQPDSVGARLNLAGLHLSLGQYQQAIEAYLQAISRQPANVDIWISLARAYEDAKQTDEAIRCYQQAVRLNPGLLEVADELQRLQGL